MAEKTNNYVNSDAVVVTENGPKDILELLAASGSHKHCSTCFSFTRSVSENFQVVFNSIRWIGG